MCEPSTQLNQSAVPIVTLLRLSWPAILEQLLLTAAGCFLLMGLFAAAGVGYSVQVAHALGGRICSVPELRCIKQPAVLC